MTRLTALSSHRATRELALDAALEIHRDRHHTSEAPIDERILATARKIEAYLDHTDREPMLVDTDQPSGPNDALRLHPH